MTLSLLAAMHSQSQVRGQERNLIAIRIPRRKSAVSDSGSIITAGRAGKIAAVGRLILLKHLMARR